MRHKYGMMKCVNEIDLNDSFFETARLYNDCIVFIVKGDWRFIDLDECTKQLINIR